MIIEEWVKYFYVNGNVSNVVIRVFSLNDGVL